MKLLRILIKDILLGEHRSIITKIQMILSLGTKVNLYIHFSASFIFSFNSIFYILCTFFLCLLIRASPVTIYFFLLNIYVPCEFSLLFYCHFFTNCKLLLLILLPWNSFMLLLLTSFCFHRIFFFSSPVLNFDLFFQSDFYEAYFGLLFMPVMFYFI